MDALMRLLLDTNVLIAVLKGEATARDWLEEQQQPAVSVITWIEVLVGCRTAESQAGEACFDFRSARKQLEERYGPLPMPLRLGHSLGCKLQLLAPDGGRNCRGLVALSFNNFQADRSIPLLGEIAPRLGVETEFSPSPSETLRLISRHYQQERNLVVRFGRDQLDQSDTLLDALEQRPQNNTEVLQLPGDHLTPASAGLRRSVLGDWADDPKRVNVIRQLTEVICSWSA